MDFKTIINDQNEISASQFLKAIDIWCRNPQIINRRILASIEILNIEINYDIFKISNYINTLDVSILGINHQKDDIDNRTLLDALRIFDQVAITTNMEKIHLYVTKQLPRTPHIFSTALNG